MWKQKIKYKFEQTDTLLVEKEQYNLEIFIHTF